MKEDVDYKLIPTDDQEHFKQGWDVRIESGEFVETVVRFGNIGVDEDNACLNFNFMIQSTPDESLTEDNETLQDTVAQILESVLEGAIEDGSIVTNEREPNTQE